MNITQGSTNLCLHTQKKSHLKSGITTFYIFTVNKAIFICSASLTFKFSKMKRGSLLTLMYWFFLLAKDLKYKMNRRS